MNAEWKPYPKVRPPKSGSYLVTNQKGGVNFGHYEKTNEEEGHFNVYRTRVIAWDFKPQGYEGAER